MHNPPDGSVVEAAAGAEVQVSFDVSNTYPAPMAYYLEVGGLPGADWGSGFGQAAMQSVPPGGSAVVSAALRPRGSTSPADAPLVLRIMCCPPDAAFFSTPVSEHRVTLRVAGAAVSPPPPEPVPPPEPERAATAAPTPVAPQPPPPEPAVVPTPPPPQPAPPAPTPAPYVAPPVTTTPAPSPTPPAAQPAPTPPRSAPQPAAPLPPEPVPEEPPEPAKTGPPTEPFRVYGEEYREGDVLAVKPGDTLLLRFRFENTAQRRRVYVLQNDETLPRGWLELVQDQVSIAARGSDEVSARIRVPANASPDQNPYLVQISTGLSGEPLKPRTFQLEVQSVATVALTTPAQVVKIGPVGRTVTFPFEVTNRGNTATSFRIAVKDPQSEADAEGARRELYETPTWRYLFDKETDKVESQGTRQAPPKAVSLKVVRKGIWWFGFKETHGARVVAVPVTDPTNSANGGNALDITAVRWRLSPLPLFLTLPLLLLLMFVMGSGATDLKVGNAYYADTGDARRTAYVYDPGQEPEGGGAKTDVSVAAEFQWKANLVSVQRLTAKHGETVETSEVGVRSPHRARPVTVASAEYQTERLYTIGPAFLGFGGDNVTVRFVARRTKGYLTVVDRSGRAIEPIDDKVDLPDRPDTPCKTYEVDATKINGQFAFVRLRNDWRRDSPKGDLQINWWPLKWPKTVFPENVAAIKPEGDVVRTSDVSGDLKIDGDALSGNPEADSLVILTTDADSPIVKIRPKGRAQ